MRILVVDDEADLRELVSCILAAAGHDVTTASGPVDALSLAVNSTFDVVLTDIDMAGGPTGIRVGSYLAERQPSLRIIYMSGRFDRDRVPAGSTFLEKPFTRLALLQAIEEAGVAASPEAR